MYGTPKAKPPAQKATDLIGFAACAISVKTASTTVQLFPAGYFRARDGRPHDVDNWYIDAVIAQRLITAAANRSTPYVLDYEHQTLLSEENGQPAPRSGKFTQLEWREGDGLYATDVVWTTRAKAYIENDEYEFISPVFSYDKRTGAVLDLYHGALTNDPALDGMKSVSELVAARYRMNSDQPMENDPMNKELLKLLGLPDDTDEDAAMAALTTLTADIAGMRKALNITEDVDAVAVIAALKANTNNKPDPAKFVPVDVVQQLQTEVAALTTQINDNTVNDLVEVALSEGKLMPAQEKWARDLGGSDIAALKMYLESAQPIAALKGRQTKGEPKDAGGAAELSETDLAVCKQMGISPDDYKKTLSA